MKATTAKPVVRSSAADVGPPAEWPPRPLAEGNNIFSLGPSANNALD